MEIADYSKERSRLITVVLTLVVIGLSLLVSTWQTMSHQKDVEEQHLFLSTRAVLLAVESTLRRGPIKAGDNRLASSAEDFFEALEKDGDVLFVGIIDSQRGGLITSSFNNGLPVELPTAMVRTLRETGEWHGRLQVANRSSYVYGKKLVPLRLDPRNALGVSLETPVFLVVGLDMEKHLSAYRGLRKNVLFQAAYILAAAIFTWSLGLSLLARRDQVRKAAALERFQVTLLDNLPDGLITLGADMRIKSANPAALDILGYAPGRLVGNPISKLPEVIVRCIKQSGAMERNPAAATWQGVTINKKSLEALVLPLTDDEENAYMLILRDRTRMRRLEQSLAEAEKLAAIGSLAAGVAHEVRNPLSSLRGFAQYFVKKLQGQQPEEEYARTMVREADRLNRVISDLLFLARPKAIEPSFLTLRPLLQEIQTLLRFDLEQRDIPITVSLGADSVYADADSLKQALLNLLLNSLDALEPYAAPGEQIPAKARKKEGPPLSIVSGTTTDGTWIEVRDQGKGMTAEQKRLAFEAFFTDKPHGTGLGLALVQRTMSEHGGKASILSSPGKGCTVRLFFPSPRPSGFVDPPENSSVAEADVQRPDGMDETGLEDIFGERT